jgi:hypothetical protein
VCVCVCVCVCACSRVRSAQAMSTAGSRGTAFPRERCTQIKFLLGCSMQTLHDELPGSIPPPPLPPLVVTVKNGLVTDTNAP